MCWQAILVTALITTISVFGKERNTENAASSEDPAKVELSNVRIAAVVILTNGRIIYGELRCLNSTKVEIGNRFRQGKKVRYRSEYVHHVDVYEVRGTYGRYVARKYDTYLYNQEKRCFQSIKLLLLESLKSIRPENDGEPGQSFDEQSSERANGDTAVAVKQDRGAEASSEARILSPVVPRGLLRQLDIPSANVVRITGARVTHCDSAITVVVTLRRSDKSDITPNGALVLCLTKHADLSVPGELRRLVARLRESMQVKSRRPYRGRLLDASNRVCAELCEFRVISTKRQGSIAISGTLSASLADLDPQALAVLLYKSDAPGESWQPLSNVVWVRLEADPAR